MTRAFYGDQFWRQTNWLCTVNNSFAVCIRNNSVLCPVELNYRRLVFERSYVICVVISCVYTAVSRLTIDNCTEKIFSKRSIYRNDTVRIRGEPWVATFTFVLSIFSIRHECGSPISSTATCSSDPISINTIFFCLTSYKANSCPEIFLSVHLLFLCSNRPVISCQTIVDWKHSIATHCQLCCESTSNSFVPTFITTSMNVHDCWFFIS